MAMHTHPNNHPASSGKKSAGPKHAKKSRGKSAHPTSKRATVPSERLPKSNGGRTGASPKKLPIAGDSAVHKDTLTSNRHPTGNRDAPKSSASAKAPRTGPHVSAGSDATGKVPHQKDKTLNKKGLVKPTQVSAHTRKHDTHKKPVVSDGSKASPSPGKNTKPMSFGHRLLVVTATVAVAGIQGIRGIGQGIKNLFSRKTSRSKRT